MKVKNINDEVYRKKAHGESYMIILKLIQHTIENQYKDLRTGVM